MDRFRKAKADAFGGMEGEIRGRGEENRKDLRRAPWDAKTWTKVAHPTVTFLLRPWRALMDRQSSCQEQASVVMQMQKQAHLGGKSPPESRTVSTPFSIS